MPFKLYGGFCDIVLQERIYILLSSVPNGKSNERSLLFLPRAGKFRISFSAHAHATHPCSSHTWLSR